MSKNKYVLLAFRLKVSDFCNELKQALTHISFFKDEKGKDGSRYVFLGMFALKGRIADILCTYSGLNGKQLQHLLGNMLKTETLDEIYAYYGLEHLVRYGGDFELAKHRHIFVYALLGFLHKHAANEVVKDFISHHFLLPNQHLIKTSMLPKDLEGQCNFLAKKMFRKKINIQTIGKLEEKWITEVWCKNTKLSEFQSQSYRYSRKQALKLALLRLIEKAEEEEHKNPNYEAKQLRITEIRQAKIAAAKAKKMTAYLKREELKKEERALIKEERRKQKAEKDIGRKRAKISAKKRQEEQEKRAASEAAKMSTMSANKRRHLEDKNKKG